MQIYSGLDLECIVIVSPGHMGDKVPVTVMASIDVAKPCLLHLQNH